MCLPTWRGDPHNSHAVRGEDPMYRHTPTCPRNPVVHNRLLGLFGPPRDDDIRYELVERVRREIAAGVYDTPEKWEAALDGLARDLK
jgi:hypothetical protein